MIKGNLKDIAAIAVDVYEDLLYWSDRELKKIEFSNLLGERRTTLFSGILYQPVSLTVHGRFLYWIDREQRIVERANKITGEERFVMFSQLSHLTDIMSVGHVSRNSTSLICLVS